jgi:hypothetical protein
LTFPLEPNPSKVWTLYRENTTASCDIQVVADGVLVRMLRDDVPYVAFSFATEEDGRMCAANERLRLLEDGWAQ